MIPDLSTEFASTGMMRVHLNFLSDSDAEPFLQGNLRVLATRGVLMTIGGGLTGGLGALYVKTILGADAVTLGLFVSIWSAIYLIFVLIGGWVSDRYDRKKILLLGTALTLPNPLIYSLAPTWHILLVANSLGALGSALAGPAYTALLVSSVGQRKRARAIAAINTLTSLANLVVPPLGAFVVQWMGGLHEIRIMFLFQFILVSGVWVYTSKALQAMPVNGKQELGHLYEAVKDVFRQMRGVYRLSKERKAASWLYISLTGPLAWGVVGPFWTIYAAEVCGSPLFVLGLLAAIHSSTNILLQIPMANISDKRGRKYAILAGRPFRYLCLVALIVGGTYRNHVLTPMIPLLAWTLMGIADSSGPSWTVASTEVMPEEFQGKWNALRDFLWSITAIPASLAGGLLWNMDPRFPFIVALIVDGLFRLPVLVHQVPETLMSRCSYPRTAGSHVVIYGLPGSGQTSTARLLQKGTKARILDESLVKEESEEKGVGILRPLVDKAEKRIEKRVNDILTHKKETIIIEGKPAVFAAKEPDKSTIVLLVAPKEERAKRRARKSRKPEFVALKEIKDKDRELARLTRKLYGADISKLPPFDVAINTDRVSPRKVAKIISIIREEEKAQQ